MEYMAKTLRSSNPELFVTPNVDQLIELERNPALRSAYMQAAACLADGAPVVLLARSLGASTIRRHTGSDLLPAVIEEAEERGWRVGIAGGASGVAQRAAHALNGGGEGPAVSIDLPQGDLFDDEVAAAAVNQILDARAHIVFLCLGSPKQEAWFMAQRRRLPPGIYVGAGAAVDFAAGDIRRAPHWMRHAGIEWLWRFALEPRRLFVRYFIRGPRFVVIAARSAFAALGSGRS